MDGHVQAESIHLRKLISHEPRLSFPDLTPSYVTKKAFNVGDL